MTESEPPPTWVDPREFPDPPLRVSAPQRSPDAVGIVELVRLCREGRIYEVERWIRNGKPIQALDYRTSRSHYLETPLRIAIETRQHDLARLLLCNGYEPEEGLETSLDLALRTRAGDLVDLLLAWGADAKKVDPEFVLDSYDATLFERFWQCGLDYAEGHSLGNYLVSHTRNTPAYGWVRRRRDDPRVARELAMALSEAVSEDKERAVALTLWAGADPHLRVPSLRWSSDWEVDEDEWASAIERAVSGGKGKYLAKLGLDPNRDDIEALWSSVTDPVAVDVLAGTRLPTDWSPMVRRNIYWLTLDWGDRRPNREALERASTRYQARLSVLDPKSASDLRRDILRTKDRDDLRWLLEWIMTPKTCDPEVRAELTRTPSMRSKLVEFGLVRDEPRVKPKRARRKGRRRRSKV